MKVFLSVISVVLLSFSTEATQLRGIAGNLTTPCEVNPDKERLPISLHVVQIMDNTKASAVSCQSHLLPLISGLNRAGELVSRTSSAVKKVQNHGEKISSAVLKVSKLLKGVVQLASRIPKVGKIVKIGAMVLDTIIVALNQFFKQLKTVVKALSIFDTLFSGTTKAVGLAESGYGVVASGMELGARTHTKMIECVLSPPVNCDEIRSLESISGAIRDPLQIGFHSVQICDNTFTYIKETVASVGQLLGGISLKDIEEVLSTLDKVLDPVLKEFERIVAGVKSTVTEAFCCVAPDPLQNIVDFARKLIDVALCPVDPLLKAVEDVFTHLVGVISASMQNVMIKFVDPALDKLEAAQKSSIVRITKLDELESKVECDFKSPRLQNQTIELLDGSLISQIPRSIPIEEFPRIDIGQEIIKSCKESLEDIGRIGRESCCVEYKGHIQDGYFCDPLNLVPYKHCRMCKSETHEFWWSKGHHGCGREPCMADGTLCAEGTTCKRCCNGSSYWWSKVFTACGREPCWGRGTKCFAGTSCVRCCNGDSYHFPNLWNTCN